jgi:hypothetical protein
MTAMFLGPQQQHTVCADTGASEKMVGRRFLERYCPKYKIRPTGTLMTMNGIRGPVNLTDEATFDIIIMAKDNR